MLMHQLTVEIYISPQWVGAVSPTVRFAYVAVRLRERFSASSPTSSLGTRQAYVRPRCHALHVHE